MKQTPIFNNAPDAGAAERGDAEKSAIFKISIRLIPFIFILYIAAYLDRVNVSFAQLQMKEILKFGDVVYGIGAGIFYLGYCLFEVPSNLILERVGARKWIARIMISWGLVSALMVFAKTPFLFYLFRFLLGVAEAGFFPGIVFYLTFWYPNEYRARAVAQFMTAIPLSGLIGGYIAGQLLKWDGIGGLGGWQWLFLMEGIPTIIIGLIVFLFLPDGPDRVNWLAPEEKAWLTERLSRESSSRRHIKFFNLMRSLFNHRVQLLILIYFGIDFALYGVNFWLPQFIQARFAGISKSEIAFISTIPWIVTAFGMVLIGKSSDHFNERSGHVAASAYLGMIGLISSAFLNSPWPFIIAMSLGLTGIMGMFGPFWAMGTRFLGTSMLAGGIAFINSVGNLSGAFTNYVMGWLKKETGSFTSGLVLLGCALFISGSTALVIKFISRNDEKQKDVNNICNNS